MVLYKFYVRGLWKHMCTCVGACGGQRSTHGDISSIALHLAFWDKVCSVDLKLTVLARGRLASDLQRSAFLQLAALGIQTCPISPWFYTYGGIWTQVLMLISTLPIEPHPFSLLFWLSALVENYHNFEGFNSLYFHLFECMFLYFF